MAYFFGPPWAVCTRRYSSLMRCEALFHSGKTASWLLLDCCYWYMPLFTAKTSTLFISGNQLVYQVLSASTYRCYLCNIQYLYHHCHHHHHHHQEHAPSRSVAVSTVRFHRSRFWARCQADTKPMLSGRKSRSMVRSQVRRGRPVGRFQSRGSPEIMDQRVEKWLC